MNHLVNNTVLSNFAAIGALDILHRLFGTLYLAEEVRLEVWAGLEAGYEFQRDTLAAMSGEQAWLQVVSMTAAERPDFDRLVGRLHYGECASIAIGKSRNWVFLTDDGLARRRARSEGVQVSGSVGALRLAAERGLLSPEEADRLLAEMIALGYRSPVETISELLREGKRINP